MKDIELWLGDCLKLMDNIPNGSIDAIITDLPYGTTACKWDTIIPFVPMWDKVRKVLKPKGVFISTASQPFTSALIMSNPKWFKHSWVWDKNRGNGHLVAKVRPLQRTEDIPVFCKSSPTYNPIMIPRDKPRKFGKTPSNTEILSKQKYRDDFTREDYTERYPTNLIQISWSVRNGIHPTQKPVELYEYLIKTYTNECETVLDITMGSGTTMLAAKNTNRKGIGIEKEKKYYDIAVERLR